MLRKLSKNAKITISILFVFIGLILITYDYFSGIKSNLFNEKNIILLEQQIEITEDIDEITEEPINTSSVPSQDNYGYIGYISIPDIKLKRGFTSIDSKYNSVSYNVMLIKGSDMPDVTNGNLILAAHRGNSSVSFFDKLYTLNEGAEAIISYNNKNYTYTLKSSYLEPKDGVLTIRRREDVNTLTLITCTRKDKTTQTVFIFELESVI